MILFRLVPLLAALAIPATTFAQQAPLSPAIPAIPAVPATAAAQAPPPATVSTAEVPSAPAIENAVVKVFSTLRRPDPYKPWSKAAPQEITGSGVVIEGKRILTNAHVVGYASQVQIQANQAGDKVGATVVAVARGMDLAVLKLDDESFFDTHPPVPRANHLPDVRDAVFAYGYPTGGSSLSITKGIISRVEFVPYAYGIAGLRIQVDAAINPGNSGGPVIAGDKMVGLAFATVTNAQNVGYIIPNEEVELFLRDVAAGHYDGKPTLSDEFQTLENPVLRDYLKVPKGVEGVVVQHPFRAGADYPLKEWDVVTHVGDSPIDNQGMVKLSNTLRVRFQYRVQQQAVKGKVALTIVRAGKTMTVQVPVDAKRNLLIPDLDGTYPSYFIYGPIVFSRASGEFLSFFTGNAPVMNSLAFVGSPLVVRRGDVPDAAHEELVVVSSPFFPHKALTGYSSRPGAVIQSINNVPVRSLRQLVALLRDLKDEQVVIRFEQRGSENIVVSRAAMMAATESVLTDNGIRQQGSQDMMDVWSGKTK